MHSLFTVVLLPLVLMGPLMAQSSSRFWVFFTDKQEVTQFAPEELLSPRALALRAKEGHILDFYDVPVSPVYLQVLSNRGIHPYRTSRWLNAISADLSETQISDILQLPFVRGIQPIAIGQRVAKLPAASQRETIAQPQLSLNYPKRQLEIMNLDRLHEEGYAGEGVLIGVFDNGYDKVDNLPAFAHLFPSPSDGEAGSIIATRDYVDNDATLYHPCIHCRHGTYVFSILAGRSSQHDFEGSAPDADFILMRTENDYSETHCEEDNWVAAAEFADSMGAQVFTTSLGYYDFDRNPEAAIICPPISDTHALTIYEREDLDGQTAIITLAADIAASRGIVVVNSAGNRGTKGLVAPADGNSVLAIGAVDRHGELASFSSRGPTADGRIKPDLVGVGDSAFFFHSNGSLRQGNGTSFSCPLVSGLVACLLQKHPTIGAAELALLLRETASQSQAPDNNLCYGIPDAEAASEAIAQKLAILNFSVAPSVTTGTFEVYAPATLASDPMTTLEVIDLHGRQMAFQSQRYGQLWRVQLSPPMLDGYYIVRLRHPKEDTSRLFAKLVVRLD